MQILYRKFGLNVVAYFNTGDAKKVMSKFIKTDCLFLLQCSSIWMVLIWQIKNQHKFYLSIAKSVPLIAVVKGSD